MNETRTTNDGYRRILGIDYGSVRVGISVCDPLKIIAQAVGIIQNTPKLLEEISVFIKKYNVESIVVGNPLNMKGKYSEKTNEVHHFVNSLRHIFSGEIIMFDERLTSVQALQIIRETTTKKQRRNKSNVDKVAAVLILQSYLDSKKNF